jgi:hypothetical protein
VLRIVNTHRRIALHHIILCIASSTSSHHIILCITIINPASSPLRLCRVFLFVLCE